MPRRGRLGAGKLSSLESQTGELFCYEIVDEPIEESPSDYGLTAEQLDEIQHVSQELHDTKPAKLVTRLEAMIDQFPQVPKLWNHLAIAYQAAGRTKDYERVAEETYRRFPEYLFGIINYAMLRLQQGQTDEVPQILHGTFALHELQNGRITYHTSEIRSFYALLALYFMDIGEREKAGRILDALEQLDPDHPVTAMVRSRMMLSLMDLALGEDTDGT